MEPTIRDGTTLEPSALANLGSGSVPRMTTFRLGRDVVESSFSRQEQPIHGSDIQDT
jgi:hypothetical protein